MSHKKYLLIKVLILLFIFCSISFPKGGHGGGGRGGGRSHGSHTSIVRSTGSFRFSNKNLISKNSDKNNSIMHSNSLYSALYSKSIGDFFTMLLIVIILFSLGKSKDHNIFSNIKKKIKKNIIKNPKEYCDNFIIKFTNLENIPNEYDTKEAYYNVGRTALVDYILIPLIINKIKIINNFSIFEKYDLFYNQNINEIDLFQLASNTVSNIRIKQKIKYSNEINNFLEKNKYIKIKFTLINPNLNKINNKYLLKSCPINMNTKNILRMYFNQQLIFQEILLKIFVESNEANSIFKANILNQIENYINISVLESNNKQQILMSAIIENILDNKHFREEFLNKSNDHLFLNLKNHTALLLNTCNNKAKIKKYNNLLARL